MQKTETAAVGDVVSTRNMRIVTWQNGYGQQEEEGLPLARALERARAYACRMFGVEFETYAVEGKPGTYAGHGCKVEVVCGEVL